MEASDSSFTHKYTTTEMMLLIEFCICTCTFFLIGQKLLVAAYTSRWLTKVRAFLLKSKHKRQKHLHKHTFLSYNPLSCGSLNRFEPSKLLSPCLFAKQAVLWGSCEYDRNQSIESNVVSMLPAIRKFICTVEDIDQSLDGFLIEIRGKAYSENIAAFAATVRTVLSTLSEHDPSGFNTLKMRSISTSSWYYSFNMVPLFVTTFAPCYPHSSPRHLHLNEDSCDSCFILLQPEVSFMRHGIGVDNPDTNWDNPQTIRDKIRVNFRKKGQSYFVPPTLSYPVASTFVHSKSGKDHSISFWDVAKYPSKLE